MGVQERLAPTVKRAREPAVVDKIPDIYFVRCVVRCTACEPLAIWTIHHDMPCIPVDGIAEAVCRLEVGIQEEVIIGWNGVFGEVELA